MALHQQAQAFTEELHRLEKELAEVRRARSRYVRDQRTAGVSKVALAAAFAVSRPTIDGWIADAEADLG